MGDESTHLLSLNDTGMAVVVAGLHSLLDNDAALTADERLLINSMLSELRKGLEDSAAARMIGQQKNTEVLQ